jgi:hypothetical protein
VRQLTKSGIKAGHAGFYIKMKIPSDMLEHLKEMATAIPLEKKFQWKLPTSTPITIPASITWAFSQNVYLKENLASVLEKESDFAAHYWVIRD